MARINMVLVLVVLLCAIGTVTFQHEARGLFHELEREQKHMRDLEVEWGQLQLEASTWAAHVRVEKLARDKLQMKPPAAGQILAVDAPAGSAP